MTFNAFVTILFTGLITNNMITVSATGADMAMNRLNTLKNAAIYGLVASITIITTTVINYFVRDILVEFELQNTALLISLFMIAIVVQICETVCERVAPKFVNEIKYLAPLLACTCGIVALNIQVFIGYAGFAEMLVTSIAYSLGLVFVLLIIAGIKRSMKYKNIPYGVQRVVSSLLILLILAMAFSAFK